MLVGLLLMINASRIAVGDNTLIESHILDIRAQMRAEMLCATGQFSHDNFRVLDFAGLKYKWGGENLARDFVDATSTHEALMASPTHRANILKREYKEVGLGSSCGITVEIFKG